MAVALRRETRSPKAWVEAPGSPHPPPRRPLNANHPMFSFFFHVSDIISPSKGNTKNVRKLEERKTDPLNLEGYVGPALLPRPPEKGRGECWGRARKCRELHQGSAAGVSGPHSPRWAQGRFTESAGPGRLRRAQGPWQGARA